MGYCCTRVVGARRGVDRKVFYEVGSLSVVGESRSLHEISCNALRNRVGGGGSSEGRKAGGASNQGEGQKAFESLGSSDSGSGTVAWAQWLRRICRL